MCQHGVTNYINIGRDGFCGSVQNQWKGDQWWAILWVWYSRASLVLLPFLFSLLPVPVVAVGPHTEFKDAALLKGQQKPLGRAAVTGCAGGKPGPAQCKEGWIPVSVQPCWGILEEKLLPPWCFPVTVLVLSCSFKQNFVPVSLKGRCGGEVNVKNR